MFDRGVNTLGRLNVDGPGVVRDLGIVLFLAASIARAAGCGVGALGSVRVGGRTGPWIGAWVGLGTVKAVLLAPGLATAGPNGLKGFALGGSAKGRGDTAY
jgi:hypothetical protein